MFVDLNDALSVVSLCISLVAVVITYLMFKKQQHTQSYSDIDSMYFEILKLGIEYPELRNLQKVSHYHKLPAEDLFRIRYETYAFICWNLCETIFDRQNDNQGDLKVSPTWIPVLLEENRKHQVWFSHNLRLFKKDFQDFVKGVVNSVEITKITDFTSSDYRAVLEMYQNMFPVEERKSIQQIENLLDRNIYTLYVARHKYFEHIIGFAFVVFNEEPEFAFLDYMAIDPVFQRCGFGTILFNSIIEMQSVNSLGLLLELELPELAESEEEKENRKERQDFYLRLGCYMLEGIDYKLPRKEGEALPLNLVFKPSRSVKLLTAEKIEQLISSAYDKIHSDVPDRHQVLRNYRSTIKDQYFN